MATRNESKERYTVSVVETFQHEGKEVKRWHTVGVAFPWTDGRGLVVTMIPGVAVSGTVVISPVEQESK